MFSCERLFWKLYVFCFIFVEVPCPERGTSQSPLLVLHSLWCISSQYISMNWNASPYLNDKYLKMHSGNPTKRCSLESKWQLSSKYRQSGVTVEAIIVSQSSIHPWSIFTKIMPIVNMFAFNNQLTINTNVILLSGSNEDSLASKYTSWNLLLPWTFVYYWSVSTVTLCQRHQSVIQQSRGLNIVLP